MIKKGSYASLITFTISLFIIVLCFSLISLTLICASISVHNNSTKIDLNYGPSSVLTGTINISISNESFNSKLKSVFSSNTSEISLKEFLDKINPSIYECSNTGCGMAYSSSGLGEISKTFSMNAGESKTLGLKITSSNSITDILSFSMSLSSTASETCFNQLFISFLNNNVRWYNHNISSLSCVGESYGCYVSTQKSGEVYIDDKEFCQKIYIETPTAGFFLGADVTQGNSTGQATLIFSASAGEDTKICNTTISSIGKVGCSVSFETNISKNITVCLSSDFQSKNKYNISYENINTCGYIDEEINKHDFSIFARPLKHGKISVILNDTEILHNDLSSLDNPSLSSSIEDYIAENYDSDCSSGCIIPINFTSYAVQSITLSDINLRYEDAGISTSETKIYDLQSIPSKISMPFKALDISKAGFLVPSAPGSYALDIMLDSQLINRTKINVLNMPSINFVYPQKVPAAIDTFFRVYLSSNTTNTTTYMWDFGDNTTKQESSTNSIIHRYADIGDYTLKITAINSLGNSSKEFAISVSSPQEYIPSVLNETKSRLSTFKLSLTSLPQIVQDYINNNLNISNAETKLASLQAEYDNAAGSSAKYIEIINSINNISIPQSIKRTAHSSEKIILERESLDLNKLSALGAGTLDSSNSEGYKEAIFGWFVDYINMEAEKELYTLSYSSMPDSYLSRTDIKITPIASVNNVYLIIEEAKSNIIFKDSSTSASSKAVESSTGIILSGLSPTKDIDFLIPGLTTLSQPVFYVSPAFSELPEGIVPGVCNYNKKCEKSLEENWKNCRSDCKPIIWAIIWILVLIIVALCIYIAIQEWYKRYYESYLFKDKNDLFNLIHFIQNAENQNMSKSDIHSKLKDKGWTGEQIDYAYKKFKGERTGLWEIPIFKFVEVRQVEREMEKRRTLGVNPNVVPRPISPMIKITQTEKTTIIPNKLVPKTTSFRQQSNFQQPKPLTTQKPLGFQGSQTKTTITQKTTIPSSTNAKPTLAPQKSTTQTTIKETTKIEPKKDEKNKV